MIHLSYAGEDTILIDVDPPADRYLDECYRRQNLRYMARLEREGERRRFHVHLQYLPAHMELLQSPTLLALNEDGVRTMDAEVTEAVTQWERRLARGMALRDRPIGFEFGRSVLSLPLRSYQQIGAEWLLNVENALLTDDAGLGKSCQCLAACVEWMRRDAIENVLIVCPLPLCRQWLQEIAKFVPPAYASATLVRGSPNARPALWRRGTRFLITNYECLRQDVEKIQDLVFGVLVADEAQVCSNGLAKVTQALRSVRARYHLALTATPLATDLRQLFEIMAFINPSILGNRRLFERSYLLQRGAGDWDVGFRYREIAEDLPAKLAPHMLRRTKAEVMPELPPVETVFLPIEMEPDQARFYRGVEAEEQAAFELLAEATGRIDRIALITKILRLQQIANAPGSIDAEALGHLGSGKLHALPELLRTLPGKVLLFTAFEKMARLIVREARLWSRQRRIPHTRVLTVTGKTNVTELEREAIKAEFLYGTEPALLILTDCFKHGVNLQSAMAVLHIDLPYNPSTSEQRVGRAHRLGMETVERLGADTRVLVYVLQSLGTLEERIAEIVAFRQNLIGLIVGGATEASALAPLSTAELSYILTGKREKGVRFEDNTDACKPESSR